METQFPRLRTVEPPTTKPTKINLINPSIPEPITQILDLVILSIGIPLNIFLILSILSRSSRRTSFNVHIVSIAFSNLVVLLEPLQKVLKWFLDYDVSMNMDYVFLVSFDVPILSLVLMNVEKYASVCQNNSGMYKKLLQPSTACKSVLMIWIFCIMTIAIQLHIFDYFEGDMPDIYICCSIIFTILPVIVFVMIDCFVYYELRILKQIEGCWRYEHLRHLVITNSFMISFIFTMVPYRAARAVNFINPKALCCIDSAREILYMILKMFPIIIPVIHIAVSIAFRKYENRITEGKDVETNEQ